MSLVLKNVSKTFVGKVAVDNISFSIEKPGVYGLLGTNGAGKTTTIRMLLGIIKKDSGEITWKGKEVDRENVNFGYLPEERGVYPKTKIMDQLMYFAELKGMKKDDAITAINACGIYSMRINSITPDGKIPVSPCVYMHDYRVGDLLKDDIFDIINSEQFKAFKTRKDNYKNIEGCKDCDKADICRGGCFAMAYTYKKCETGEKDYT